VRDPQNRTRLWQIGGGAFIAGSFVGLIAGPPFFPFALALTILIVSGGGMAFAVAIRAAGMTGDEASDHVYQKCVRFLVVAAAMVAAFAGYCLSGLLLRGAVPAL
jgi:hypothetical protein